METSTVGNAVSTRAQILAIVRVNDTRQLTAAEIYQAGDFPYAQVVYNELNTLSQKLKVLVRDKGDDGYYHYRFNPTAIFESLPGVPVEQFSTACERVWSERLSSAPAAPASGVAYAGGGPLVDVKTQTSTPGVLAKVPCPECGKPMTAGSKKCAECYSARAAKVVAQREETTCPDCGKPKAKGNALCLGCLEKKGKGRLVLGPALPVKAAGDVLYYQVLSELRAERDALDAAIVALEAVLRGRRAQA